MGTLRHSDENQKAACKQPPKAFTSNTSNAISHTTWTQGYPNSFTKNSRRCAELMLKTLEGRKESQNYPGASFTSFTIASVFPAAMLVRLALQWKREPIPVQLILSTGGTQEHVPGFKKSLKICNTTQQLNATGFPGARLPATPLMPLGTRMTC